MQPCYGITETRLTSYYTGLRVIGVGAVEVDPFTKALLCLSGLHYAFSYYKAARSGSEFETFYAPAHRADDGLHDTARTILRRLMRGARRRTINNAIALASKQGPLNEEWLRWRFVPNVLDAIAVNRRKLALKSTFLTWALACLIAAVLLLGGYFIYALFWSRLRI